MAIRFELANSAAVPFQMSEKHLTSRELAVRNSLPAHLFAPELYPTYTEPVWHMAWKLTENAASTEPFLLVSEWLLKATWDVVPLPEIQERAQQKLVALLDDSIVGARAGRILFGYARGAGWSELWPRIQHNPHFGTTWAEACSTLRSSDAKPLEELSESDIGTLYTWMRVKYPKEEDPLEDSKGHGTEVREHIGHWRDAILQHLLTRERANCES